MCGLLLNICIFSTFFGVYVFENWFSKAYKETIYVYLKHDICRIRQVF